jgi:hypothetical protein
VRRLEVGAGGADSLCLELVLQNGVVAGRRGLDGHLLGMFAVVIVGVAGVVPLALGADQAALPAQVLCGRRVLAAHDGVSLHGHRGAGRW